VTLRRNQAAISVVKFCYAPKNDYQIYLDINNTLNREEKIKELK
jgi:hypothetical protein